MVCRMLPGMHLAALLVATTAEVTMASSSTFRFANIFDDSMVMQRGSPLHVWGLVDVNGADGGRADVDDTEVPAMELSVVYAATDGTRATVAATVTSAAAGTTWSATLPPQPPTLNTTTATISLMRASSGTLDHSVRSVAELTDVLIGDVVLVSGQSNVGISVIYSNQDNATAEQENEHEADRIGARVRLFAVGQQQQQEPQRELPVSIPCKLPSAQCSSLPWSRANRTNVQGYSALGWYIARELYAMHGESVPVGVVQSDVPGTPIQKWT